MNATTRDVRRLIERQLDEDLAPSARSALVRLMHEIVELEHGIRARQRAVREHRHLRIIHGRRAA